MMQRTNCIFILLLFFPIGALSQLIANPLFVARTRLCLQYEGAVEVDVASSQIKVTRYNGIWDVFRKVYKYEGIKGLYQVGTFV